MGIETLFYSNIFIVFLKKSCLLKVVSQSSKILRWSCLFKKMCTPKYFVCTPQTVDLVNLKLNDVLRLMSGIAKREL